MSETAQGSGAEHTTQAEDSLREQLEKLKEAQESGGRERQRDVLGVMTGVLLDMMHPEARSELVQRLLQRLTNALIRELTETARALTGFDCHATVLLRQVQDDGTRRCAGISTTEGPEGCVDALNSALVRCGEGGLRRSGEESVTAEAATQATPAGEPVVEVEAGVGS